MGGTALGTVNVTVTSTNGQSLNIVATSYDSETGTFTATFAGIPNYWYTVQWSDVPSGGTWTALVPDIQAGTNGLFQVSDTPSPSVTQRYYRTVFAHD
jgi:hypothetical protein